MKRVKNAGCRCFSIPVNIGLIRLMLLIRCPENAAIIKQTLEGNDIWATTLPSTRRASFNVFFSILIFTSMSLLELQNSSAPPIQRPMRLIITEVIYR